VARAREAGGRRDLRAWVRWGAALAVSGGLLAYLFLAQGIAPGALVDLVASISWSGVGAFVLVSLAALLLRALRYWLLLERRAPFGPLVLVTAVRNLFVDLLPARTGAAASYLYLVTARLGLPLEAALASFALSFLLDTLALAPLLVLAVMAVGAGPLPPGVLLGGSLLVLAGSVAALAVLAPALRVAAAVARMLPWSLDRVAAPLHAAAVEVRRLEGRRVLMPALGLSLLLRVAKYGAYYCLLQALLVGQGQPWWSLNFVRVFLSVAGAELAASLPLPTLASVGPYEAAGALGFAYWLGLDRELATVAATAFHGLSQVHDYGLGLLALLWLMAPGALRRARGAGGRRARRLALALLGLLALGGGTVAGLFAADRLPEAVAAPIERLWTRLAPPSLARGARLEGLAPPEVAAVPRLAARLDGLIVWSSNRGGNHDLYLLDLREQSVRRVTRHPHVDFFSRFSPDGRRIVFLRSHRPWVSFRETSAWDVYVVNADGTGERLVARRGYHPTWTPDGRRVLFLRDTQVRAVDVETGEETLVLDGRTTRGIRGGLETPELARDGRRLALTVRSKAYNGVAVVELDSGRMTKLSPGQACQLTWTPGQGLVWVEPGGRGGTSIFAAPGPDAARTMLMDLPDPRSHEYFPRVAGDDRWLIWGATAKGHEHDRADYDLFVWEIGTPPGTAIRLTNHPGNDQWPDLWVRPAG
jgi:uncharacterized membrane protein YbhN (UPF0104 family)